MINIEKEFFARMDEKFSECKSVAFHLVEYGALTTKKMEFYLIKDDFRILKSKGKTAIQAYIELGESYFKSFDAIRYIIEKS